MKGAANILSILVALRARVYSRARSKGCKAGSKKRVYQRKSPASIDEILYIPRLRGCFASDPGAWIEARLSALIFYSTALLVYRPSGFEDNAHHIEFLYIVTISLCVSS